VQRRNIVGRAPGHGFVQLRRFVRGHKRRVANIRGNDQEPTQERAETTMNLYLYTLIALGSTAMTPVIAASEPASTKTTTQPTMHVSFAGDLVLSDGQRLQGRVDAKRIVIPASATVVVDDDLLLNSELDIVIEGRLVARDRSAVEGLSAGPRIELFSRTTIEVWGAIEGGRGVDYSDTAPMESLGRIGGDGSDVVLSAPAVYVDGQVRSGAGGRGGTQAHGGNGGTLTIVGAFLTHSDDADYEAFGGDGAMGGDALLPTQRPGDSGDGGAVLVLDHPDTENYFELLDDQHAETDPVARSFGYRAFMLDDAIPPAKCEDGAAGPVGADSLGGQGAPGVNGTPGSAQSQNGGPGSDGGKGGPATGGKGKNGFGGQDCCHVPAAGGNGGPGGGGGDGTGGKGGVGGKGGNAYANQTGGNGGNGGNGGDGTGGDGGDGGKGGPGVGPGGGGLGGPPGGSTAGAGGKGGKGGSGNPNGTAGNTGGTGASLAGNPGITGLIGDGCPKDDDTTEE